MRKLIVLSFITLDGVIQAPGGPEEDPTDGFEHGGWVAGYFDDFLGTVMNTQMNKPFDLLLPALCSRIPIHNPREILAQRCPINKCPLPVPFMF